MKAYPKYKPSNIEWIGEIPDTWNTIKVKRLSQVKRGASPRPIDDPKYFDDAGEFAWVRISDVSASDKYLENTTQKLSEIGASLSVKQYPGDIFLSIAGTVGKPIITKIKCCIHDGFVWFPNLKINPEFLYYIFSTGQPYYGLGKWGTQLNLNTETVGYISIPLPSNELEIENIVKFLNDRTQKLDTLIEKKQKLIELLKEERIAIINQAVTKGLNPDVPMKDSGIEWIGEIPAHWEIRKVSRSFKTIGSGTTPNTNHPEYYENGTINWVITGDLNENVLNKTSKKISELAFKEHSALKIYPKGTLLIALYGATIGKVSILGIEACTNQACCSLANSPFFNIKYLFYWFLVNKQYIIQLSYGGGQPNISQELIRSLKIPCPNLEEQQQIITFIEAEIAKNDSTIAKVEKEIELLQEYRTALISEAVTGKIDVREAI